eukprot:TRINITY_DN3440_c1_g1_i1.p1 TRINITY_DN3440_c1_g1~~TRINITY_DN3440_c1_g1_i1.p1  ORF type:complete len:2068 (-),score=475.91 TRINITY_DN3440_c1_g1_i1:13-5871(-)
MLLSSRTILCKQSVVQLTRLQELLQRARWELEHGGVQPQARRKSWWARAAQRTLNFLSKDEAAESTPKATDEAGLSAQAKALELSEAARQTALVLSTEQNCMQGVHYDPRLVSFEFVTRIALRKKQVTLVRAMQAAVEGGQPLVHQMLMGEGKTTVVTPLVILLNGTAERVCVVCCPAALIEFTCKVLKERLCSVMSRPVVEFTFTRSTPVSDDHFFSLLHAQDARAVLCSGPTSLKSLMLRFVLTLHMIDVTRSQEHERTEVRKSTRTKTFFGASFGDWRSLLTWPGSSQTNAALEKVQALRFEARALGWALGVFRGAVLLLDDIDLLMHPLRSELHWPLGEQHKLDFTAAAGALGPVESGDSDWQAETSFSKTVNSVPFGGSFVAGNASGARWQVAFHLLDGFFSCQLTSGPALASFEGHPGAAKVLERLKKAVERGLRLKQLQAAPHLALLSSEFYHKELRPILAEWVLLWLRRRHPLGVDDAVVLQYLCAEQPGAETGRAVPEELRTLSDTQIKALNLCRSWLSVLLPHLASRVHRVHYGLLDEDSPTWCKEPRARRYLAVPFVGKDAPSDTSQFSHPDVLIGLTWLAFRLGGLRHGDFRRALRSLSRLQKLEADLDPRARQAHRLYNSWVHTAGAYVRGLVDGNDIQEATGIDSKCLVLRGNEAGEEGKAEGKLVPPLEWIDSRDESQVSFVFNVLSRSPFFMEFYLHDNVFPELLRHTDAKLSATGQDLGGEVLCGTRLGFTGTPNDLLPRALGKCHYAQGDDAKMLNTLSDGLVVDVSSVEEGWSAKSLLKRVATHQPPLSALIDVGALITGLSNMQVAQVLLDFDLPYEAVVFCDQGGEQRLLRRGRAESVRLANCTLPLDRRFVFYDQVHTTGIDIRHSPWACAALTLGKDSTFRDFAQGAYRMRGIGCGQRLQVLLTPEVSARINEEVVIPAMVGDRGAFGSSSVAASAPPRPPGSSPRGVQAPEASLLDKVCAWLLVRQAASEHTQHHLLRRQAIQYEGRRCAYDSLVSNMGSSKDEEKQDRRSEEGLLDLFRDRVDYSIEVSAFGGTFGAENTMKDLANRVRDVLDSDGAQAVNSILSEASGATSAGKAEALAELGEEEQALFTEMEQEHEQELFAEQEQEKEQEEEEEEEEEQEEEAVSAQATSLWQNVRREEQQEPWQLGVLGQPPSATGGPFHLAAEMELASIDQSYRGASELRANFPAELWVSNNFHRPGRGKGLRRLRSPMAVLEWVPDVEKLAADEKSQSAGPSSPVKRSIGSYDDDDVWDSLYDTAGAASASGGRDISRSQSPPLPGGFSREQSGGSSGSSARWSRLKLAMELGGMHGKASISLSETKALLASLGIVARPEEVERVTTAIEEQAADDAFQYDADEYGLSPPSSPSGDSRTLKKALSARTVARGLRRAHAIQAQAGRYYLLLSLGEAEAFRAVLHHSRGRLLPGMPCQAALRLLRRDPLSLSVLDATKGWTAAPFQWQQTRIAQNLLFLGAEAQYTQSDLDALWRQMRARIPVVVLDRDVRGGEDFGSDGLRDFFLASHSMRRRAVLEGNSWQEAPVASLFQEARIYARQRRETLFRQAYARLLDSGILPEAAFAKLSGDKDKVLPSDFAKCQQLGIRLPPELLLRVYEELDTAGRSAVSIEEWTAAFELSKAAQKQMAASASSSEPLAPPEDVPLDVLRRIAIELVSHTSYLPVWNSEGTFSRKNVSVWEPDQLVSGIMRVTAIRLSLGHYANQGFADVRGGSTAGVGRRSILQVRDRRAFSGSSSNQYLQAVADHYCPCPAKFRQVWSQRRGRSLFIWRPVPPSDAFVALGMVVTTTAEPPPLEDVRCVPKSFCRPAAQAPLHLWDDSGSGGKPASMWLVNNTQVLWAVVGHQMPHETFWELASESITFDYTGRPSLHVVHEREAPGAGVDDSRRAATTDEADGGYWSLSSFFSSANRRKSI